jgi:predicted DNA-binding transcriptional regulator YafY
MKVDKFVKLKLVKIWEILSQETDEEHPMTTQAILDKLAEMGIVCDRRTLYADIKALNECGYEICCKRAISNEYYVKDRSFSIAEIRIMMDAVQAAGFITDDKTEEFIDKLAALAGSRRGEALKDNIVAFNNTKTDNGDIYYNVETITAAIQQNKKVKFTYFDYDISHKRKYRKEGKFYYMNPYALVMDNDNYYFLGCDMYHDNMISFRVDRMEQVQVSRHDKEDLELLRKFDLQNYKKQIFGMYSGDIKEVTIRAHNELMDTIYDLFGPKTRLSKYDDNEFVFSTQVQLSPQFFGWCCSFGDKLKITAPNSVVNELEDYIEGLVNAYTKI